RKFSRRKNASQRRAIGDRFTMLPITRIKTAMEARTAAKSTPGGWCLTLLMLCVALLFVFSPTRLFQTKAQSTPPVLVSEEGSTRGVAVDSVTRKHEPFSPISDVSLGADNRTRVMLFAMNLANAASPSDVTASAEDGAHNLYALSVEYVGTVPG